LKNSGSGFAQKEREIRRNRVDRTERRSKNKEEALVIKEVPESIITKSRKKMTSIGVGRNS
jgi:hypothetical protein